MILIYSNYLSQINIQKQIRVFVTIKINQMTQGNHDKPGLINLQLIKWFSIGASAFTAGYLAYKKVALYFTQKQSAIKVQQTENDNKIFLTEYSKFYFDKNAQAQLIQQSLGDPNDMSLQKIYAHSPTIARDQFINFTQQIRRRRRLVRKVSEDQYVLLMLNYYAEIEELLGRSRLQLTEYLKIDPEEFINMEKQYQGQDLRYMNYRAEQSLKHKLITHTPVKKIRDQILLKIFDDQIAFVKNKMYERLHTHLSKDVSLGQDKVLKIVYALLEDIIYEKYGYQWEDIERKISEYSPRKNKIIQEKNRYLKMMEAEVGEFNYESLQSLENQQTPQQFKISIPTVGGSGLSEQQ